MDSSAVSQRLEQRDRETETELQARVAQVERMEADLKSERDSLRARADELEVGCYSTFLHALVPMSWCSRDQRRLVFTLCTHLPCSSHGHNLLEPRVCSWHCVSELAAQRSASFFSFTIPYPNDARPDDRA